MLSGRNLHDLGLMNGTILRLLERRATTTLTVEADGADGRPARGGGRPRLQLAYACSVHKGQGIELPVAVLVAHPAAGAYFLRREMLYTAMTRARTATVIVGQRGVVARAAARPTPRGGTRGSGLGLRTGDGTCPPRSRPRAPLGRPVSGGLAGRRSDRRRSLREARRGCAAARSRTALGAAGRGRRARDPRPGPGRSPGGRPAAAGVRRLDPGGPGGPGARGAAAPRC